MDIEHIGYMVRQPAAAARWYVENLGLRIVRSGGPPADAHFLADTSGHVMIEIYNNPSAEVPDYAAMNPLVLHLAFETGDVEGECRRLVRAGAKAEGEITYAPNGDVIAIVRDPWGFPVQLAKRGAPMI
ncbi:MAG: VOC family protein [Planctomycetota bacterium]|nr:VOC family protein [Planctomycetota bacterium]